jgi:ligand-binding sensor domain-containing protein
VGHGLRSATELGDCLLQSRDGYLWLGTLNGLVRFDGVRFTVFDENNTPGLPSSRIVHLFEDHSGTSGLGRKPVGRRW